MKTRAFATILAIGAAACSSGSNGGGGGGGDDGGADVAQHEAAAPSPFAGTWTCSVNYTLTYTQPPNAPFTGSDTLIYSVVDNGDGTITLSEEDDAGPPCPQKYTVSGTTATLAPGQTCHAAGTQQDLTLTYTDGTITAGTQLSIKLDYGFTGTQSSTGLDGGTQQIPVAGKGNDVDNCAK
jgi:hypothetical protein